MSKPLHLPDLTIRGFRGIDQLSIPRLGRVTLLAGKNGVGKTTVLEAVRVYAARGRFSVLAQLLTHRQEIDMASGDDGDATGVLDGISLFYGKNIPSASIFVGSRSGKKLRIEPTHLTDERGTLRDFVNPVGGLSVSFGGKKQISWNVSSNDLPKDDKPEPETKCEHVGPEIVSERDLARFWDHVALTDNQDRAVQTLELIIDEDVVGVAMIGDSASGRHIRRAVVRLKGQDRPVPLKSIGDGAVRLFGFALAIANSRGGFLLIDEVENGIHHSIQQDLWKMILRAAHANDVQVLATTHSWDCVRGFAYATAKFEDGEGVLVRLDRDDRGLRAVEYSKEGLLTAAEQGIEVR